jgi:cyanophycin synthetase
MSNQQHAAESLATNVAQLAHLSSAEAGGDTPHRHIHDLKILRTRYLRGPNIWTYRPVLETWLDLGTLEDWPSDKLRGFNDRLLQWLPALVEHQCGVGERGGFIQRLHEGTWLGHVLEHVVIELLNLAGMPTGFGQTRSTSKAGVYRMVFRARDERVGRTALAQGHALLMAAVNDTAFDMQAAVAAVRDGLDTWYFGPSTAAIIAAATDRRIPHVRLNDGNLVQFGYGAKSRRIWTAETDATSAIAESIARDKTLTKQLIGAVGVPVPEGAVVDSPQAAWQAAQDLGLPVVIKPSDGNHGRGVTLDLRDQADIEAAFEVAARHGSEVIVERNILGHEHRLLVVGSRLVAAARGNVATVTGDGVSSVLALVESQINNDPRRGDTEHHPLSRVRIAEDGVILADLQRQGLTPEATPKAGLVVMIQRNGNVAVDCTDQVHPQVAQMVILAARTVGLDIAGVDVVAQDISQPLHTQGGAVVEVNAGPGLLMHLKPAVGTPRPVGRAIVDQLFKEDESGRIPIIGITGSQDTTPIARMLAWLMQLSGHHVGLACRDGVFVDRRKLEAVDGTQWDAAQRLLINRSVDAAVFEHSAHGILNDGLPYDKCRIGVVTDLEGADTLGDFDVQARDQMPRVMRTQVDIVMPDGCAVLNGDDADVAALATHCDGAVVMYTTQPPASVGAAVRAHVAAGGRAVALHQNEFVLLQAQGDQRLASVPAVARSINATASLVVAATGVALNISPELIGAALATFHNETR